MQKTSIATHRGKDCIRYFIDRKPRYRVLKNPANPEAEILALHVELANGGGKPKPRSKSETLQESLAQWEAELLAEHGPAKHYQVGQTVYRATRLLDHAGCPTLPSITASKVRLALGNIRKPHRKPEKKRKPSDPLPGLLSEETRRQYTQCVKQFVAWCCKTGRLSSNPLAEIRKKKTRHQPNRRDRFQPDELGKLISHATTSEREVESVSGVDRGLLYHLAATSGLRRGELASLTPASFELGDRPQLVVRSAYTKDGNEAILDLHPSILAPLRRKLDGLATGEPLWPGLKTKDTAKMVQTDLVDAGLPVRTEQGIRGFHSLRNSFISALFDAGVNIATVQKLARHATASMTLSYARQRPDSERQAIVGLSIPGV
jgi:integrase